MGLGRAGTGLSSPVAKAAERYGAGDHKTTVEVLHPLVDDMVGIGGSLAQQDIFRQILIDAAIRGKCEKEAAALLRDRVAQRPQCPATRAFTAALAG